MNVIIITPIYYIEGRKHLFHDSSAVHYLVKPWSHEHKVVVLHVYSQSFSHIKRYADKEERCYHKDGYHYQVDNVDVFMIEIQRFIKQQAILNSFQSKRVIKYLKKSINSIDFIPDVIVSHMPTTLLKVVSNIFPEVPKMAVLHITDVLNYKKNSYFKSELSSTFDIAYARSKPIRDYFIKNGLEIVNEKLIISGAPVKENMRKEHLKPQHFKIIYVGKLIKRKNIDKVIFALSYLRNKYDFSLNIYGEGNEKEKLVALAIEELGRDLVCFNDPIPHEEVLTVMNDSNIFVMPSKQETLGLVYLEAMACSDIVIGSVDEGIDGVIVNESNGFLVVSDDIDSLKNAFEKIFTLNTKEYEQIAKNALITAHKFSEKNMGYTYLSLIQNTLERMNNIIE